jgi:hypothetical protein
MLIAHYFDASFMGNTGILEITSSVYPVARDKIQIMRLLKESTNSQALDKDVHDGQ